MPAERWWNNLVQRYRNRPIDFSSDAVTDSEVPGELFDSVVDNLLENALKKSVFTPELRVRVEFSAADGGMLVVTDNGSAVPNAVVGRLFAGPVPSDTGFGVGLYQSNRLAADLGYSLSLTSNSSGAVSFVLRAVQERAENSFSQRHVA